MAATWNATNPTGGNSLTDSAFINGQYTRGDFVWVTFSGAIVWLEIPGIGFFYAGLSRRKNALASIWQGCMTVSIISFQWFLWGYSLTFSHTANAFIGDLSNIGLRNTLGAPSVGSSFIPDLLLSFFQNVFAGCAAQIVMGGSMERGALGPSCMFIFIWTTIVYDAVACWTWNPAGWLFKLGTLDYAGGGPVHIASGAAGLAYALFLRHRRDRYGQISLTVQSHRPHNTVLIMIGFVFLWFGWLGFNGGSGLGSNLRAAIVLANTNIAAACGALAWVFMDFFSMGKWSAVGLASGGVAGLVAITPACGFVPIFAAVPIGVVAGILCNLGTRLKTVFNIDDGHDVFALHSIGGAAGSIMTGIFAADYVAALDGVSVISGGWIQHNWIQVAYQLAGAFSIMAYSFVMSYIILYIMDKIPGLNVRVDPTAELDGLDASQMGESQTISNLVEETVKENRGEIKTAKEDIEVK